MSLRFRIMGFISLLIPSFAHAQSVAEAIDQPGLLISNGGHAFWIGQSLVTQDGVDAAQNGNIHHAQFSEFSLTAKGPGTVRFWWKASTEPNFDSIRFFLNGKLKAGPLNGTTGWEQISFSVTAGSHNMKWIYQKDESGDGGSDSVWVDQLILPPPIVDADGDELDDGWERTYFGNLGLSGSDNPDGDPLSNEVEFSYGTHPLVYDDVAFFPDAALDTAIRNIVGQAEGLLPRASLTHLNRLDISRQSISDLTGLSAASGLQELICQDNYIADLRPLQALPVLRKLYADRNAVVDLSPLVSLSSLQELSLSGNPVVDWSPIASMPQLKRLFLDATGIDKVDFLSTLWQLEWLSLTNNQIADITPLQGCTSLRNLYLSHNRIAEIGALAFCSELRLLSMSDNRLENITPLATLPQLQWLYLERNAIVDLGPLSGRTQLIGCYLSSNQVEQIDNLFGLPSLRRLDLENNLLRSVNALTRFPGLQYLYLSGNRLTQLPALAQLGQLRELTLSDNQLSVLPPLNTLTSLRKLALSGNQLRTLDALSGLQGLQILQANRNLLENLAGMESLTALQECHLSQNRIRDLTPLATLTNLRRLHLEQNRIQALAPLASLSLLNELSLVDNLVYELSPLTSLNNLAIISLDKNRLNLASGSPAEAIIRQWIENGLAVTATQQTYDPLDVDADFLPDTWEIQYFASLARDGWGDYDGDGQSDSLEEKAGTHPGLASSRFHLIFSSADQIWYRPFRVDRHYRLYWTKTLESKEWNLYTTTQPVTSGDEAVLSLPPLTSPPFRLENQETIYFRVTIE